MRGVASAFALAMILLLAPVHADARDFRGLVFTQRRPADHAASDPSPVLSPSAFGPRAGAPSSLVLLQRNGRLRVLVDCGNPRPESLLLIDVGVPSTSPDARTVVFSGRAAGEPAGWRIYAIDTNGANLRQLTFSEALPDANGACEDDASRSGGHDDTDPVFLTDGRIVFASTRASRLVHGDVVRVPSRYVMDADASGIRRIGAAERIEADALPVRTLHAERDSPGSVAGDSWIDAAVLPSGRVVASLARRSGRDFGLYLLRLDGTVKRLVYDAPGTDEANVRVVLQRPLPPKN